MIGEDDGSVALGDASHGHVEDAMGGLDVMLLQAEDSHSISRTGNQPHAALRRLPVIRAVVLW